MSLAQKIKSRWGYELGTEVVLYSHDGNLTIGFWPDGNAPSIAEIEAVEIEATRTLAPFSFQARFTDAELVAIQLSTDAIVIRGRTMLQTIRDDIDLTHPDTIQLLQYMTAIGLVSAERATEILS